MKHREPGQNQLIYGIHAVQEAIDAGQEVERIYLQKEGKSEGLNILRELVKERKLPVHQVPVHKLNRLVRGNHQGAVAFLTIVPNVDLHEMVARVYEVGMEPKILVLDNITDVRNFGAIARSAVAFGYHGIVIPFKGSVLIHADAVKASAGALMKIPISRVNSLTAAVNELANSGLNIIAITEKASEILSNYSEKGPHALVLGSEEKGINENLLQRCNTTLKIEMSDQIDSLNVSVAAAISMYQIG